MTPRVPDQEEPIGTELGGDDLIDALANRLRWANAHEDLRDYWTRRFEVLCRSLSLDPTTVDQHVGDDKDVVRRVLRSAATGLIDPPNPFRGILEGGELLAPIYREVSPALGELARMNTAVNRQIARACLLALAPELEHRTCPTQVLIDADLDLVPPDPDLYW